MTDFKVPPGSSLEIDLRRRRRRKAPTSPPAPGARGLVDAEGDSTRYVFRGKPSITILDLGTRLVSEPPYSYRELDLFYPISYDTSAIGPTVFGGPLLSLTEGQWDAIDAELLGGDPFGHTTVEGRRTPNVLPLNPDAPLGYTALDLYASGSLVTAYPVDADPGNEFWKWVPKEVDAAAWSAAVTAQGLAPGSGRYVQRKPKRWDNFYLQDFERYWDWYFFLAGNWTYMTDAPDAGAPRRTPPLKLPLRVFGAPVIYRPVEESSARAQVQGQVEGTEAGMFGWAIVQEIGINFTARLPQIPLPGQPGPETWLAQFPAESLRTLRRVSTWKSDAPTGATSDETIEWTLVEGRRPKSQAEIRGEAIALATAEAAAPLGDTFLTENPVDLEWVTQLALPAGHLVGAVEVNRKIYYVWRDE